jgi:hypothetical protein
MADKQITGNYKETETYKRADGKTRSKLEQYKKENGIGNDQMYLLLLREDYRSLPREEVQKGNRPAELMVLSGIITFLVLTANQKLETLPFIGAYLIVATIIYFSGILNPIGRQLSNINKLLKKFPEAPSLKPILNAEKKENNE